MQNNMKQVRGQVISWIFIFIIYGAIQVFAATVNIRDESAAGGGGGSDGDDGEQILSITTPNPAYDQSQETNKYELYRHWRPTYRPKRENCTPPAIEQFPRSIMRPVTRKHGGLIIHFLVAIFTFLGLAIVCDNYFESSLDRICEELRLSPDVAGATFMAARSSAPELATVLIGVFVAKDDIGVSSVIGSAVFNIMFVISVCALCSGTLCYLNWWPLVRDCFFYLISILVTLTVIFNGYITWYESLIMMAFYIIYCIALHFNASLEKWAYTLKLPIKLPTKEEQSALDKCKSLPDMTFEIQQQQATNSGDVNKTPGGESEYYKSKHTKPQKIVSPLEKPTVGGIPAQISWAIVYPIHYMCQATIPDCRTQKYRNWYALTFLVSMIWISFYSYFMVWMITIIGSTLGIPDTVMGLTFVAAGFSVPDTLSSIAAIKEGYGDMAVSNVVGSNVFDLLICLGLPWLIQTSILVPGGNVNAISKGLTYSTLSLLSTVVFLLASVHLNSWKLDKHLGIILMIWYLLFITLASLYELNVFGIFNYYPCQSEY